MQKASAALACVAVSVLTVLGTIPTVHAAEPIQCGDVITTDVVLTKNLTCSGDGLRVAGPGDVSIDLNGYRLRGDGTGIGIGIAPEERSPHRITVTGGRIEGFSIGVRTRWVPGRLHQVTLTGNTRGITSDWETGRIEVSDSVFLENDVGLHHATIQTMISGSSFRDNGIGILCRNGNLRVVGSRFSDNQYGIDSVFCRVDVESTDFIGGRVGLVSEPGQYGINIRNNTFKGAGIGVHVTSVRGSFRVADSAFVANGASGLVIDNYPGHPALEVSGNVFKGNGFLPGTQVGPTGSPLTSGVWSDGGSTFTGNTAIGNAGHGIEAYGATDGGGNVARDNGVEPQCIGVVCAHRSADISDVAGS